MIHTECHQLKAPSLHLFLRSLGLLGLEFGPLLPHADQPGVTPGQPQLPVGMLLALEVANGALLDVNVIRYRQNCAEVADDLLALLGCLDIRSGSITLRGLAVAAWEEDEALLVLLQTLYVGLKRFF